MKCKFIGDVAVDVSTMAEDAKQDVRWRPYRNHATGLDGMEPCFPAGTVYDHPNAAHFVDVGMAIPADDECAAACKQLTPEQRQQLEMKYRATAAGVTDPRDRELYMAGVITGYKTIGDRLTYVPGPNYPAWKAAQDTLKQQQAAAV